MTSKGKNFSCNNLGQRRKSDFYETPFSMTAQLLSAERFSVKHPVLEPACGNGAITNVLTRHGFSVEAYDVDRDFLKETRQFASLITNPPFSLAFEFIIHAKKIVGHKFALLLPLSYLHGKERYDAIYQDKVFPLKRVWVFTRYPMLGDKLRRDGKYRTGMMVYAWFVWDRTHSAARPSIGWLDNDPFVLRKR